MLDDEAAGVLALAEGATSDEAAVPAPDAAESLAGDGGDGAAAATGVG